MFLGWSVVWKNLEKNSKQDNITSNKNPRTSTIIAKKEGIISVKKYGISSHKTSNRNTNIVLKSNITFSITNITMIRGMARSVNIIPTFLDILSNKIPTKAGFN